MAVLYYESQLAHHGIKGQKWGVRRFQRSDGRLTLIGQRRQQKRMEKLLKKENRKREAIKQEHDQVKERLKTQKAMAELNSDKQALSSNMAAKSHKPSYKDMSDDELTSKITRLRLEKSYIDLMRELGPKPKEKSKVHSFIEDSISTMSRKAVEGLGDVAKSKIKKWLGEEDKKGKKKKNKNDDDDDEEDDDDNGKKKNKNKNNSTSPVNITVNIPEVSNFVDKVANNSSDKSAPAPTTNYEAIKKYIQDQIEETLTLHD